MDKLFGSSGVRGLVNIELTSTLACNVGLAVATYAKAKCVVVARDTRVSGVMIQEALVSGLISCGVTVYLIGVVPTPVLAYTICVLGADVGFMITASHNPPQYNGIKVFNSKALSYVDADQIAVEKIFSEKQYTLTDWKHLGKIIHYDAVPAYLDMVKKAVVLHKKWHVVVDPGCGAAYQLAPQMLKMLGCKVTALNAQPDGYFPARASEPTVESLKTLSKTVQALGADIGIAFDGDADRVAFVDENGKFVNFDHALASYSAYILKQISSRAKSSRIVVTNVEASMCVETLVEGFGGKVLRTRVGDIYVSESIMTEGAVFGGEPCGAWVHPLQHYCPDGPLSAVLFLKALEVERKTVSLFVEEVPKYITLRENVKCSNEEKNKTVTVLAETLKNQFRDYTDFSTIDGVRLALKNGWLLIRASGTEPLIRVTVEGKTENVAKELMHKVTSLIQSMLRES
ncbi:MAG: phosphoglucosamine mutase [Nitrososphaerota archaeon]|jgi:phosphoglucosamine mutase|nr:phosphoglucosamine mutase [Nitrososphaerota archaeon]